MIKSASYLACRLRHPIGSAYVIWPSHHHLTAKPLHFRFDFSMITSHHDAVSQPARTAPLVVDADPAEVKEVSDADNAVALATTNPIRDVVSSYLENVFQPAGSEGSAIEIRNQRLAEIALDELERPRFRSRASRPYTDALRARQFRSQPFWGQL